MGGLFSIVNLPEKLKNAQMVSVEHHGSLSCFIFGSRDNGNIYKYNNKTKLYNIYDKYKLNTILIIILKTKQKQSKHTIKVCMYVCIQIT